MNEFCPGCGTKVWNDDTSHLDEENYRYCRFCAARIINILSEHIDDMEEVRCGEPGKLFGSIDEMRDAIKNLKEILRLDA